MKLITVTALTVALFATACNGQSSDDLAPVATALTRIAEAVAAAADDPAYDHLRGDDLLQAAVSHDRSLMRQLNDYRVFVRREGRATSVLVCDRSGSRALLEDSGCTMQVDAPNRRGQPCSFSLPLDRVCR